MAVYGMMLSLGEMATWLPIPGAIPQFCARYVDDALGFVVGWNASASATIRLIRPLTTSTRTGTFVLLLFAWRLVPLLY